MKRAATLQIGLSLLPALLGLLLFGTLARADSTELPECVRIARRYFGPGEVRVSCNEALIQITPYKKPQAVHKKRIRIGSFNLFHLGDKLSFYKNYDWIARIMDQWDVVAGLELMPLPTADERHNAELEKLIKKTGTGTATSPTGEELTAQELALHYVPPGYVRLLKALRELDPSWALSLSPKASGENITHVELSGIFYRSSAVSPKPASYCNGEPGCMLRFPKSVDPLVSRVPFLGSFVAGTFDFYLLATHVRFREPKDVSLFERILKYFPADKWGFATPGSHATGYTKAQEVSRFAEVKATLEAMGEIASQGDEADVILAGDFNLQYQAKMTKPWARSWEHALGSMPGAEIFVREETSLSETSLVSEYDHFVFDPARVAECEGAEAARDDFTDGWSGEVEQYLKDLPKHAKALKSEMQSRLAVDPADPQAGLVPRFVKDDIDERLKTMNQRLRTEVAAKPYQPYIELLSDHLPISMECSTEGAGD